jgi:hypothetical protein
MNIQPGSSDAESGTYPLIKNHLPHSPVNHAIHNDFPLTFARHAVIFIAPF